MKSGATLRNPLHAPALLAHPETTLNRMKIFETHLKFDAARALQWAFASTILTALWPPAEDGSPSFGNQRFGISAISASGNVPRKCRGSWTPPVSLYMTSCPCAVEYVAQVTITLDIAFVTSCVEIEPDGAYWRVGVDSEKRFGSASIIRHAVGS